MAFPAINTDATVVFQTSATQISIGAATTSTAGAPIYALVYLPDGTNGQTITPHTGFSHVASFGAVGGLNQPVVALYVKTSSGSESGSYTFEVSSSTDWYLQSWWVSGVDESDPLPAAHRDSNNSSTAEVTTIDAPSVTTGRDDCRVVRIAFYRFVSSNPTFSLTALEAIGSRGVSEQETQSTAGATGTATAPSSTAGRAMAVTLAFQPPDEVEPTERRMPEVLTDIPLDTESFETQVPADQNHEILIPVPDGEGTFPEERTLLFIHSKAYLPKSVITAPAQASAGIEGNDDEVTGASVLAYWMPEGYVHGSPEYVFDVEAVHSAGLSDPRIWAYALRVRWTHPTVPLGATPQVSVQGGQEPVGNPDGLVRFLAMTPDAGVLKSLRFCIGSTRRNGAWTIDGALTRVLPGTAETSNYVAAYEEHDGVTEAPLRTASHDAPLNPPTSSYGRAGMTFFIQGAPDEGTPGNPDHTGTKAVSWESALLVAKDNPGSTPTDTIKAYRHTATMAGDPTTNGTLIHTFSPSGSVVHATGWDPEETYFLQYVATNANGSTLGEEFTVTMWRQAAHVLTTAQTLVVPMEVTQQGVSIEKKELHGSNVGDTSWAYNHPGGSLLVFVSARDPDGLATMDGVTWNAVAMTKVRGDASSPTGDGSYIFGGIFFQLDAPAGTFTLAASTTGGTPSQIRWHVYSLSGPNLAVRDSEWNGADVFNDSEIVINVPAELGDLVFDHVAWTFSAVNVASRGEYQTQELADDSPTRMNSTSALATVDSRPGTWVPMSHTADDNVPDNVSGYWGASISSSGGTGAVMKSLEIDAGLAALTDEDLWHG